MILFKFFVYCVQTVMLCMLLDVEFIKELSVIYAIASCILKLFHVYKYIVVLFY